MVMSWNSYLKCRVVYWRKCRFFRRGSRLSSGGINYTQSALGLPPGRPYQGKLPWIRRGACLKGGAEVIQPLPDWRDLPADLRLRVQQQSPEQQGLWAELRDSPDEPAEFLDLLRIRLDNDDIVAAVASALDAAFSSEWGPISGAVPRLTG